MTANRLLSRLEGGEVALGLANTLPAAGIVETMCGGWDFVWIDMQHGQIDCPAALAAVRAADVIGIDTMIRSPGHDFGLLGPVADLAPSAVMVPMVDSADQARGIVTSLCFPPVGNRSYGGRRVLDKHGRHYYRDADLLVVAQIETPEALRHVDAIAGVEGVGALFFGPADMRIRMGFDINTAITDSEELMAAMAKSASAAKAAGKFAGTVANTPGAMQAAVSMGYQLLVAGHDAALLQTGAGQTLEVMRKIVAS